MLSRVTFYQLKTFLPFYSYFYQIYNLKRPHYRSYYKIPFDPFMRFLNIYLLI